jgi:nitrile hydratase subunit beta
MNGVHDMGGMQDMGPVRYEKNEPVFHQRWEARLYALTRAMRAWKKWNIDAWRYSIELIPPAEYLRMSYYEKWFAGLVRLLVETGMVTSAELESGRPEPGEAKAVPALSPDKVPRINRGEHARRDVQVAPRFQVGQRVRARNMHPTGHTRLPRYARGKQGTINRDHGVYVFPDTNAEFLSEKPQHIYSVRFAARELWGEEASPRDAVYLDTWDDYLEPV